MFDLAKQLLAQGQASQAEAVLIALTRDPNPDYRAEARFRLAQLHQARSDLAGAEKYYRALLDEKPDAAGVRLELANILAARDKMAASAREFKRAQAAGLPPEVAKTVDRIVSVLRSRKRFGGNIEVGIAPDSNINRATLSNTVEVCGLSFTLSDAARAQSGVGLSVSGQGYLRLPLGKQIDLSTQASVGGNFYTQSDFSDFTLNISSGPEIRSGKLIFRPAILGGKRWFGGSRYSDQYGGQIDARRPLGKTSLLSATGSIIHTDYALQAGQNADSFALQFGLEKAFSPKIYTRFTVNGVRNNAVSPAYAHWSLGAGVTFSRQMGQMTGYGGISYNRLDSDGPFVALGASRQDSSIELSAGLALRQIHIAGLSPIIRFSHSNNRSSLTIYSFRRNRIEFGLTGDF